jgi:hypothetical protein
MSEAMRLLVDIIDWEYPPERQPAAPTIWDLLDQNTLMQLVLALGNGIIVEMRAEADSDDALAALRDLLIHVGSCQLIDLAPEIKQRLWLYVDGDQCYQQGTTNPGYIFVNPLPQPAKFS